MHRTTPRFWRYFEQLPEPVRRVARQNFGLLLTNPRHLFLHFKKVGKYWSARVDKIVGQLQLKMAMISLGFGSVDTTNMRD